jgi:hypothetical protein
VHTVQSTDMEYGVVPKSSRNVLIGAEYSVQRGVLKVGSRTNTGNGCYQYHAYNIVKDNSSMLILRPIFIFAHRIFYHKIASEDSSRNTTVDTSNPSLYQGGYSL